MTFGTDRDYRYWSCRPFHLTWLESQEKEIDGGFLRKTIHPDRSGEACPPACRPVPARYLRITVREVLDLAFIEAPNRPFSIMLLNRLGYQSGGSTDDKDSFS